MAAKRRRRRTYNTCRPQALFARAFSLCVRKIQRGRTDSLRLRDDSHALPAMRCIVARTLARKKRPSDRDLARMRCASNDRTYVERGRQGNESSDCVSFGRMSLTGNERNAQQRIRYRHSFVFPFEEDRRRLKRYGKK